MIYKKIANFVLILNESVYIYISIINMSQFDRKSIAYNICGSILMIISFVSFIYLSYLYQLINYTNINIDTFHIYHLL
jgi:hypothetical protein